MTEKITVKKNNFTFNVIDDDLFHRPPGFDYWEKFYPDSEPSVFRAYDKYLNKQKDFLDIGAWIGPNTLYAAELSRKVIAVEPDPVAFSFLQKNIEANKFKNVILLEKAFSSSKQVAIDPSVELGDSMTRVLDSINSNRKTVDGVNMEELLSLGDYSLIKIDIEGYESIAIPSFEESLINAKIPMLLSLHTSFNPNREEGHRSLVASLSKIYTHAFDDYDNCIDIKNLPEGFGCFLLTNEE
jgi:FkbM family methyltransferase